MRVLLMMVVAQVALADVPEVQGSSLLQTVNPPRHRAADIAKHNAAITAAKSVKPAVAKEVKPVVAAKLSTQEVHGESHSLVAQKIKTPVDPAAAAAVEAEEAQVIAAAEGEGFGEDAEANAKHPIEELIAPMTPEELDALSAKAATEQAAEEQLSNSMSSVKKTSNEASVAATMRGLASVAAEDAHTFASDANKFGKEKTLGAADSRTAANVAVAAMNKAKEDLLTSTNEENDARTTASAKEKAKKAQQVKYQTIKAKREGLDAIARAKKAKENGAKAWREAKDEEVYVAQRVAEQAAADLLQQEADESEKKHLSEAALGQYKKAQEATEHAVAEKEVAQDALAKQKAVVAKAEVNAQAKTKDREVAHDDFEVKTNMLHALEVEATKIESQAKAATSQANTLKMEAKEKQDVARSLPQL